ncbi:MAG: PAS domain S-box protein, partial [Planctomycetota bacterium]
EDTGNVKNYETRLLAKDGRVRNVLLTLSRLRDSEGNPIGTIGISKDVTQEKRLQTELREAKEYLEGIIEHSADIIITVDSEGLIETFNRGGEEALGYRREEVIGRPIKSLYVDPRERDAAAARLEDTGSVKNYETRLLAKDGRVRNVLLTLSRFRDSEGNPIGTIGISKDITHEKKLQDELRDAKEYLEGIIENSADIIITVTPDGIIETFNRGAEQALGYRRAEVIGMQIETLFADPRERDVAVEQLKDSDNVKNYETRFLTKSGQVRNVLLTLSRLRDREGSPIGTFGISKDVTQEKELQRELVQSQKFAAIGQAVTRIQHAIKNMLNSLKGGAYLVRNGMTKDNRERIEEGWVMVEEGIERISNLSYNMLNFAREWKPELQRADLSDLVVKVCEQNRQAAANHGVALRHEVREGLPVVLCDPKLIHMATTDLVVNAIDACTWKEYHSGETPEVVLETSLGEGGDSFVIKVCDNGCGMTEEIRRNIFTPFFSTKETLGSGLGLAVTARIIRVHGGEISVESEPDRGTTFRIHIPKDGSKGEEADDGQASSRN